MIFGAVVTGKKLCNLLGLWTSNQSLCGSILEKLTILCVVTGKVQGISLCLIVWIFMGNIKVTKEFTLATDRTLKCKTRALSFFATKWNQAVGSDILLKFN